ncbi:MULTISPECIES: M16 family metallopeptidase [Elizabethkingia]|uniref:M16 family metallopeptidase n=1 Tax=Elizabethkingia TaxID=308865 RepID=UPI001A1C001E|nr:MULTISPECIES: pitrilysin family protein [Elizabethkingia]MCT3668952.1 insulinase family protein [Elizabethkingia anophelis]MCT3687310.1 insulinase family protein [Elizabethkingia anophelis]MCT3705349.1 insulinase family protein [Elizabethkingia anophelis]MCT3712368.1 insulinase family protein [Elizabethkingia anophelis]MCT3715243.1 insulinase family protein [Elizabethkingia anophelis]
MKKHITYIAASFLISGIMTAQNIDINVMPKPGPTPVISIANPQSFKLSNGLTVLIVENHKLPRVNVTLSMDRPPVYEGNIAGVNGILASQLGNGTTTMSKDDFNKRVDFMGSTIRFSSSGAFANSLSKYFPETLALMADAAINPKFSQEEIQKSKERSLEGLKSNEKNAQFIASKVSNAVTYGKNTAKGEFETEETIRAIQLKDVQDAYNKYYSPNNAYLAIVGDVKFSEVKKLVEKSFNAWKKSNYTIPNTDAAKNVAKTEINIINVPNAVQSIVSLQNITTLKMKDPQYFSAIIANDILGGGGEARLFMNLREKNGFTYGAYSSLSTSKYSPTFAAGASVRNDVTDKAIKEFVNELNGITTIKPEELAITKAKLKGNFIRSMEEPGTIAGFAINTSVQNLPKDFYTNYLKSIDNVTIADAQNAAKTNILPNQSRIFIAGKAADISEGLEKLGYPVNYYDKDANKIEKPATKKVDASVSVASIADKYINAIGGKTAIAKLTSISSEGSATMQGMELIIKSQKALGGKLLQEISAMGNTAQKMVFDGKDGYMMMMGNKTPLPEDIKTALLKNTSLFEELDFAKKPELKVSGIEKIGGEDSYVIKDGKNIYYYSVNSGLKTGETKTQKMNGQEMTIPTVYSNYKDVNGVKLPHTLSQSMMGQDLVTNIKSYTFNTAKDTDFK